MTPQLQNPNARQLLAAAEKLGPLLERITFVGGCATGLLLTDPAAAPVRPTLDVDAIIAITSYAEFVALEELMRHLGFQRLIAGGEPLCRWKQENVVLDLMPTEPSILGFTNRWYRPALEHAGKVKMGEYEIRLITGPYFLATKLDAFDGRGRNDYRMSRDLEDIVTVLDGRPEIITEVRQANSDLQKYLSEEFSALLASPDFVETLPGHLLPDATSQQRIHIVVERMQQITRKR